MKNPSGYGTVYKLSGKRRKPYVAKKTVGWTDEAKQLYKVIGYFETRAKAMEALANYNLNPYDTVRANYTFSQLYEEWSAIQFEKSSNQAISNYKLGYKYCEPLYNKKFTELKKNELQYAIDVSGKAYSTRKVIKTLMNKLYDYAIENDICNKKYSNFVDIGENEAISKRSVFTEEEIHTLFENENNMEFIDTILIMIYTGMRIGELLSIKHDDVFLDKRYMIGGIKTAAGKNRVIPIHNRILPLIKKWYDKNNNYLITNYNNEQMKYDNYKREKFENIMEKLNMNHNPHDCRHTFASRMDSAGANKLCIKRIMGHASADVTDKVYTHKTISELIEAVDTLK